MAIDDEIGDEKLQGNKNGEAEKISVLSSWKSDMNILQMKKYYLLVKNEWKNSYVTYSPLGKAFEKQVLWTIKLNMIN